LVAMMPEPIMKATNKPVPKNSASIFLIHTTYQVAVNGL
jgi:hypothetical protein